jgi:hypothetical protein
MSVSTPSQGTHFSDGVRTGPFIGSSFIAGANVLTPSVMVSSPIDKLPPGVFNTPMGLLDEIPAPVSTASIAALQLPVAAGYLNLVATSGIGITVLTYNSVPNVLQLDCPRNVVIQGSGGTTSQTFFVYGWDQYGMPVVEQLTGPAGALQAVGKKTFLYIRAVYVNAGTVANVSIGVGNVFGLPYLITDSNYLFTPMWNGEVDYLGETTVTTANNSLTMVNASSVVTVTVTSTADLYTGQSVTIAGATTAHGITDIQLNITAPITVIDATHFSYTSNGTATSTGTGGGAAVTYKALSNPTNGDERVSTAVTGDVRGTYSPLTVADGNKRLTINFYSASGDGRLYNAASNGIVNLLNNPITITNGSAVVSVNAPNHQFTAGENVTISGATAIGNLTTGQLNITAPVTIIDADTFTYVVAATATSSTSGGGAVVKMTPRYGNLYQTVIGRFGVPQFNQALI